MGRAARAHVDPPAALERDGTGHVEAQAVEPDQPLTAPGHGTQGQRMGISANDLPTF